MGAAWIWSAVRIVRKRHLEGLDGEFRSSPVEYLEECLSLLRDNKVPISEYDGGTRLRQTLMNFYADMMEIYERG